MQRAEATAFDSVTANLAGAPAEVEHSVPASPGRQGSHESLGNPIGRVRKTMEQIVGFRVLAEEAEGGSKRRCLSGRQPIVCIRGRDAEEVPEGVAWVPGLERFSRRGAGTFIADGPPDLGREPLELMLAVPMQAAPPTEPASTTTCAQADPSATISPERSDRSAPSSTTVESNATVTSRTSRTVARTFAVCHG